MPNFKRSGKKEMPELGIVTDVKQELRRCSALKIMYAARKTEKK